ncbi:MAG: hypothetical protein A2041_06445 [Bacteroidetes bacterium GWA2_31_9b]|nr:MAG: hypothetical protein A2041_06445 [Bacteroidetes bacterium GWA2_31_9b]
MKHLLLKVIVISLVAISTFSSCENKSGNKEKDSFSFVFITDIHLQPEKNATIGFKQAIDSINKLNPDFVLTGGDQIMDALGQSYQRSDSLYNLYNDLSKEFKMPVYNTIGNHDIYGIYSKSGADKNHPEYGIKMFEKRIGKTYYSFIHKGWKFMALNSIVDTKKSKYHGLIDSLQIEWIKNELSTTDTNMPIVLFTHIPLFTIYKQKYYGATLANDSSLVVINAKEVVELFDTHNLKLVLQGHLHTIEDIYVDGTHFITGGSICGSWWNGSNYGFEEGFMYITISNDIFNWKYVDYGWDIKK